VRQSSRLVDTLHYSQKMKYFSLVVLLFVSGCCADGAGHHHGKHAHGAHHEHHAHGAHEKDALEANVVHAHGERGNHAHGAHGNHAHGDLVDHSHTKNPVVRQHGPALRGQKRQVQAQQARPARPARQPLLPAPVKRQSQQIRPLIPSRRQVSNTLRNILSRRPLIDLSRVPNIRNNIINNRIPFLNSSNQSKRRSQNKPGRLLGGSLKNRLNVPKIAYLKAEQIPGFQKFELHDVIRAREGTQIFDGRKPDVIHYVESPNTEKDAILDKIDVRTPQDVNIVADKS